MAASRKKDGSEGANEAPSRKKRYEASATDGKISLTPQKLKALELLLDYRFLIVPQAMKLMAASDQSVRRCFRDLCDAGLVDKIAVPRAAFADDGEANDVTLTYGSAPTIHVLTKAGTQALVDAGIAGRDALKRPPVSYGPQNSVFLRHEMFVRDIRVWLSTLDGYPLISWQDGPEPGSGKSPAPRPDGTFAIKIGGDDTAPIILAGFIEADRGTERGASRWTEKLKAYAEVFSSTERTKQACGYNHARVLVVTRTEARRDRLWEQIEEIGASMGLGPDVTERFWMASKTIFDEGDLLHEQWRIPGADEFWPLSNCGA